MWADAICSHEIFSSTIRRVTNFDPLLNLKFRIKRGARFPSLRNKNRSKREVHIVCKNTIAFLIVTWHCDKNVQQLTRYLGNCGLVPAEQSRGDFYATILRLQPREYSRRIRFAFLFMCIHSLQFGIYSVASWVVIYFHIDRFTLPWSVIFNDS